LNRDANDPFFDRLFFHHGVALSRLKRLKVAALSVNLFVRTWSLQLVRKNAYWFVYKKGWAIWIVSTKAAHWVTWGEYIHFILEKDARSLIRILGEGFVVFILSENLNRAFHLF
jgi:hypothetical protein